MTKPLKDSGLAVALAKLNGAGWLNLSIEERAAIRGTPIIQERCGHPIDCCGCCTIECSCECGEWCGYPYNGG